MEAKIISQVNLAAEKPKEKGSPGKKLSVKQEQKAVQADMPQTPKKKKTRPNLRALWLRSVVPVRKTRPVR